MSKPGLLTEPPLQGMHCGLKLEHVDMTRVLPCKTIDDFPWNKRDLSPVLGQALALKVSLNISAPPVTLA